MVRVLRGRRRARVRTKRDRMSEGMRRRALTGEEAELEEQGHGAARRSIGREFYLYILTRTFFLSMCPSIHLLLDFNNSPALTCGTHPCNCPSYPLAHLLNSHKKRKKLSVLNPPVSRTPPDPCPIRRRHLPSTPPPVQAPSPARSARPPSGQIHPAPCLLPPRAGHPAPLPSARVRPAREAAAQATAARGGT